jgi:hypothetical protein
MNARDVGTTNGRANPEMTSCPSTAAPILAVLAVVLVGTAVGCTQDRKLDQVRRGIDDVDRHSKEIEKSAEPAP